MLDFVSRTLNVYRFWNNGGIQQIRYVWLLKKFENHQKQGKKLSEAWHMNPKIDILPLLVTRKILKSSETNITSHN